MFRRSMLGLAVFALAALALAGCGGGKNAVARVTDTYGDCKIKPGTVCKNQDLSGVDLSSADLTGADLSGSDLARTDFTGANLANANLSDTLLAATDFTRANLTGANFTNAKFNYTILRLATTTNWNVTGAKFCFVQRPDGFLDEAGCARPATPTTQPKVTEPPQIVKFATATNPAKCLNDVGGTGVEIVYEVKNASSIVLNLDDLKVGGAFKEKGTIRIPFLCDGREHTIDFIAVGPVAPPAQQELKLSLNPGEGPKKPGAVIPD
jgi:hypothetical protein